MSGQKKINHINIIGGGLSGCEAALHLARNGISVKLYEMKPKCFSPAHRSDLLGELVCSNSLKSEIIDTASGLLKEELTLLGSFLLDIARSVRVPAGQSLAVDRTLFASRITERISNTKEITVERNLITALDSIESATTIIATGPLSYLPFLQSLKNTIKEDHLYFYDSIAPIVDGTTLDRTIVYRASRYGKGSADYLNIPLTREDYHGLVERIGNADKVRLHPFEQEKYYEACLPVEVMVERGVETLAFGPFKPVGLLDPRTGRQPFAVIQLRRETVDQEIYNLVGFQTKMTYQSQEEVLRSIPGMDKVKILRHGSIHRNTFVNAPSVLNRDLSLKESSDLFLAGQLTGVEGYMESTAMGLLAAIFVNARVFDRKIPPPPATSMIGALLGYITNTANANHFQPMGTNFGLLPMIEARKDLRRKRMIERAIDDFKSWRELLIATGIKL